MLFLSIFTALFWVLYKVGIANDPEYVFNIWNELPFYTCNTMVWLGIFACIFDNKSIMAYGYYVGVPCALLALFMPDSDFFCVPLLSMRGIGYYGTHAMVIILGLLFVTLNLFEIDYKNAAKSIVFFIAMSVLAHIFNIILRFTVFPEASYYYTFGLEENAALSFFYRLIPVPLLYFAPIFFLSLIVVIIETYIIRLFLKRKTISK